MKVYKRQVITHYGYDIFVALLFGIYISTVIIFGQETQSNTITNIVFIILAISQIFLILISKKIRTGLGIVAFLPFLLLLVIGTFYANQQDYAFSVLKTFVLLFLFSFLIINSIKNRGQLIIFTVAIGLAGVLAGLYSFSVYGYYQIVQAIVHGGRERIGLLFGNPNGLGYLLAYGLLATYYCFYHFKNFFLKLLALFLCVALLLLVIATGSRRALLICLFGLLLLSAYVQRGFGGKLIAFSIMIFLILAISNFPLLATYNERIGSFLTLFTDPSASDVTDQNRINLLKAGLDYFMQRPILGYGTGSFRYLSSSNYFLTEVSSHNNFLEIGVNHGLIGLVAYYAPLIYLLINIWGRISKNKDLLGSLFFVFIFSEIFIVGMTSLNYTNKISVAIISMCFSYLMIIEREKKINYDY